MEKDIIGRWVYIDIPAAGFQNVRAKVDTGAYRSSLHCDFIEQFERDGVKYVKVQITDLSGHPISDYVTLKQKSTTYVKSSNGEAQQRPIVELDVIINTKQYTAEFSLSNREDMKFPILLGRKLLRGNFVVDVSMDDPQDNIDEYEINNH